MILFEKIYLTILILSFLFMWLAPSNKINTKIVTILLIGHLMFIVGYIEKAKTNREYENYMTEKTFNEKLGRMLKK